MDLRTIDQDTRCNGTTDAEFRGGLNADLEKRPYGVY